MGMHRTPSRSRIVRRALAVSSLAALAAGCSGMHGAATAPAPQTAQDPAACLPALAQANAILTVPGDSLSGEAAARTTTAYTVAMQGYAACVARAAAP